jgi:hypothetical protein
MTPKDVPAGAPASATKWIVSILVLGHFFAIAMAVTQSSTPQFPTPDVAMAMNVKPVRMYQQFTFLGNAYRFYAPEPGPVSILWFRMEYEDGSIWWLEMPLRHEFLLRMPYQRNLSLTMLVFQNQVIYQPQFMGRSLSTMVATGPVAGTMISEMISRPGMTYLVGTSQIAARSYVRHVAKEYPIHPKTGAPITRVIPYQIQHLLLGHAQVLMGWTPTDARTYAASEVGIFKPDGTDVGVMNYILAQVPALRFAGDILLNDYYRLKFEHPAADSAAIMAHMNMPRPLRALLDRFPELKEPTGVREAKEMAEIYLLMKRDKQILAPMVVQSEFWMKLEQMLAAEDKPIPSQSGFAPMPAPMPRQTKPAAPPRTP